MNPDRSAAIERAEQLRQKAEFCRQAAGLPTTGGTRIDRQLIEFARRLEREAAALEQLPLHDAK